MDRLGFYVVAPAVQIADGVFGDLVSPASIESKVRDRVRSYSGERDDWLAESFLPVMDDIEIALLSSERVLDEAPRSLHEFYSQCLEYNGRGLADA